MIKIDEINLSFPNLILGQIRTITGISSQVTGATAQNGQMSYKNTDKVEAWIWAIKSLEAMIPTNLIDKQFTDDKNNLNHDKSLTDVSYWLRRFNICVSWACRRGYLTSQSMIGGSFGVIENDDE